MTQTFEKSVRLNPFVFFLRTLLYMAMALLLRVIALAPLACLLIFPSGSLLRFFALLCPAQIVFFILPLRFSFAEAIAQRPVRCFFSFDIAFTLKDYPKKLAASLRHALSILKWGIPFIGFMVYLFISLPAASPISIATSLGTLGQTTVGLYSQVAHIIGGIFGNAEPILMEGGLAEGLLAFFGILGGLVLIWLYGAMRNSAYRYIWAISHHNGPNPHAQAHLCLRSKRFLQLLFALANTILWIPFLLQLTRTAKTIAGDLAFIANLNLMDGLSLLKGDGLNELLIGLLQRILPLLLALFALYFPLLPIRRILTATFSATLTQHPTSFQSSKQATHAKNSYHTSATEAEPAPAYVPHASSVFSYTQSALFNQNPAPVMGAEKQMALSQTTELPIPGYPQDQPRKKPDPRNDIDSSAFTIGQ